MKHGYTITLLRQRSSQNWIVKGQRPPKKGKSAGKVMASVLWDARENIKEYYSHLKKKIFFLESKFEFIEHPLYSEHK